MTCTTDGFNICASNYEKTVREVDTGDVETLFGYVVRTDISAPCNVDKIAAGCWSIAKTVSVTWTLTSHTTRSLGADGLIDNGVEGER